MPIDPASPPGWPHWLAWIGSAALASGGLVWASLRARRQRVPEPAPEAEVAPGPLVELRRVSRVFVDASGVSVTAVADASLSIERGEIVGLIGPSGQGKSTLLNLIGGLDVPSAGSILFAGRELPRAECEELRAHRAERVSFVFQDLNLVTHLSALDNAALPLVCAGVPRAEALARARESLARLEIGELSHRLPNELSGGQKQRVAIARAFTSRAPLVLADEPTGSLDPKTARDVMDAFCASARAKGRTVLLVTHNTSLARRCCDRIVRCTASGLVELGAGGDDDEPAAGRARGEAIGGRR
jgi:ABC-type lipoprotein export system ATPase subunit